MDGERQYSKGAQHVSIVVAVGLSLCTAIESSSMPAPNKYDGNLCPVIVECKKYTAVIILDKSAYSQTHLTG